MLSQALTRILTDLVSLIQGHVSLHQFTGFCNIQHCCLGPTRCHCGRAFASRGTRIAPWVEPLACQLPWLLHIVVEFVAKKRHAKVQLQALDATGRSCCGLAAARSAIGGAHDYRVGVGHEIDRSHVAQVDDSSEVWEDIERAFARACART